ncbi:DRTGG domain-containing protein [Candidatus Neomarinimicrobiota bacterium]
MTIDEIVELLNGELLTPRTNGNLIVHTGCGCDLMSDVLAFIKPDTLLLTGLTNAQVIRTAEMADIKAICFVRGKKPSAEVVEFAEEKGITLLATASRMFEACGLLHEKGLLGCSEYKG